MLVRRAVFAFALLAAVPVFPANLVVNGGFETGDFTGWTVGPGASSFVFVDTASPHTGLFSAHLGNFGALVALGQMVTTTPGGLYNLSFFLENNSSGTPNEFQVSWDGHLLLDNIDMTAGPYVMYSFNVVASGTSTDLEFIHRHDPDHFFLDDVAVQDLNRVIITQESVAPEPAGFAFMLLGIAALAALQRRDIMAGALRVRNRR